MSVASGILGAVGAVGGGLQAGFGGTGSYSLQDVVKSPMLQRQINQGAANNQTLYNQNQQSLNQFISAYLANQGQAQNNTSQETGSMGQFYNGQMASQLAQLRAQRASAINAAANVASQQALRATNQSLLGAGGSGGSYAERLRMGALIPIQTQAAVDNANQARSDLGYITQNQIGLAGQRNALMAQQAAYGLVPAQMRQQFYGQNLSNIGGLENLYSGNNIYGVKYTPSSGELAGQVISGSLNGFMSGASMGLAGGGGGTSSTGAGSPYVSNWSSSGPITAGSVNPYSSYGSYGSVGGYSPMPIAGNTTGTWGMPTTAPTAYGYGQTSYMNSPYAYNPASMNVGNYGP